jgi:transcription elongation factor Elf1
MLRPFPPSQHFDYELRCLVCEDCKKNQPYLCAVDKAFTETTYVCGDCLYKRELKKREEAARQRKLQEKNG